MSARRAVLVVVVVAGLVGLAHGAYWFHVAGLMRKHLDAWADHRRAAGWQVEWQSLEVGGYPLRLRARMESPRLAIPGGLQWSTQTLVAEASPFDLTRSEIFAAGRHDLVLPDGRPGEIRAGGARLVLDLTPDGAIEDASLVASDLAATVTGLGEAALSGLALGLRPLAGPEPAMAVSLSAQDVALPQIPGLVLDQDIQSVEIAGRVMGEVPPGPPLAALEAWSEQGGVVELDRVQVEWKPVAVEAEGTLAFDPAMQPLVALSARVRGYAELMDRLAAAGAIDPGAANAAKLVLALLAKPDSLGRPAIAVPLTLQDGALYLGPAKVGEVPPIDWDESPLP